MSNQDNALFSETVSEAFSNALSKQPSVVRRKDTINNASGAFLQIASLLTTVSAGLPLWVSAILAAIIGIVQILFSATTEGPLAPSQERKIVAEIKKINKPEVAKAGALNTLLNIFDAVEIERAKEREQAGPYGKGALSETVDVPEGNVEPTTPETLLDTLRDQVSDTTK